MAREVEEPALVEMLGRLVRRVLILLVLNAIWLYQYVMSGQLRSRQCRFQPTCSEYARVAITRHGLITGSLMAYRRLERCGPDHPGGYDPVP